MADDTLSVERFYVYEHWRPDENRCFYVGKGHGKRAYNFKRSRYHRHVVQKLHAVGLDVDVRIVAGGLSEEAALAFEVERIAFWRSAGVTLTNLTAGGDGTSGFKWSVESVQRHSQVRREKMSDPVARKKISDALKGRRLTEHQYEKHRTAMARRRGVNRPSLCDAVKEKIRAKALG